MLHRVKVRLGLQEGKKTICRVEDYCLQTGVTAEHVKLGNYDITAQVSRRHPKQMPEPLHPAPPLMQRSSGTTVNRMTELLTLKLVEFGAKSKKSGKASHLHIKRSHFGHSGMISDCLKAMGAPPVARQQIPEK